MTTVLDVKNLSITFERMGKLKPILNDVSFHVKAGSTLGVVGESGSGKSMLALAILQLIQTPPLHTLTGEVVYRGENLLKKSPDDMRRIRGRHISMIFQEPSSALNPVYTIGNQIVEMICTHQNISKSDAKENAISLLTEVGIPDPASRFNAYPHELSGGMKQRAMIAIALAAEPEILIADEPTTALDVTIQMQILQLLKRIQDKRGMTILFITHDLGVIAEVADDVLVIYQGMVKEFTSVTHLFENPKSEYANYLLSFLPSRQVSL